MHRWPHVCARLLLPFSPPYFSGDGKQMSKTLTDTPAFPVRFTVKLMRLQTAEMLMGLFYEFSHCIDGITFALDCCYHSPLHIFLVIGKSIRRCSRSVCV